MLERGPRSNQLGLTLVELMVGVVVGLMIVGVVVSVFVGANRNFTQDQLVGRMQENARHATRIIAQDLSMLGFWGPVLEPSGINAAVRDCTTSPDNSNAAKCGGFYANTVLTMAADDDCGPGTGSSTPSNWAYEIGSFVEVVNESSASDAEDKFECIDGTEFLGSTDILVIKRLQGQPVDANRGEEDDDGKVFLRTNGDAAMMLEYDHEDSAPADAEDWEYLVRLYYVRNHFLDDGDGIPTLYRKTLDGNGMETEDGGVAQGIEYVHVMFGIDTGSDGIPDYYKSQPTAVELRATVTAKVYVLARSIDPDPLYTNAKTYQLGDVTKDFSGNPDSFYRRVFTTTVAIRNRVNLNRIGITS